MYETFSILHTPGSELFSPPRLPFPVLSVGAEAPLLLYRHRLLRRAGITVRSFYPTQAELFVHDPEPHIWIFCGSIEPATLVYLACAVRRHSPASRLLLMKGPTEAGAESCLFHRVLNEDVAGETMVAAIRDFESRLRETRSRA